MKIIKTLPAIMIAAFFTSVALADYTKGRGRTPSIAEKDAFLSAAEECDPDGRDKSDMDAKDLEDYFDVDKWEIYRSRRGGYVGYLYYECD